MVNQVATATEPTVNETDNAQSGTVSELTTDWSEITDQALKRVQEFVQASLRKSPPEVAAVDTSNGLFYKALFQLDRAVDEALQRCEDPIDRIDGLARAIDLMLRIARQIDRFGQLRTLLLQARRTLPDHARN